MNKGDRDRLDRLIKKCVSVIGRKVDSVAAVLERRMRTVMQSIMNNVKHPLHETIAAQRSQPSNRLLSLCSRTQRFKNSFVHFVFVIASNF